MKNLRWPWKKQLKLFGFNIPYIKKDAICIFFNFCMYKSFLSYIINNLYYLTMKNKMTSDNSKLMEYADILAAFIKGQTVVIHTSNGIIFFI